MKFAVDFARKNEIDLVLINGDWSKDNKDTLFRQLFNIDIQDFFQKHPEEKENEKEIAEKLKPFFEKMIEILEIFDSSFLEKILKIKDDLKAKNKCDMLVKMAENFAEQKSKIGKVDKICFYTLKLEKFKSFKCYYRYEGDVVSLFKAVMTTMGTSIFDDGNSYFECLHALFILPSLLCSNMISLTNFKHCDVDKQVIECNNWKEKIAKLLEANKYVKLFIKKKKKEVQVKKDVKKSSININIEEFNIQKSKIKINKKAKYRCVPMFIDDESELQLLLVPSAKYENFKEGIFKTFFDVDINNDFFQKHPEEKENEKIIFEKLKPFFDKTVDILSFIDDDFLKRVSEIKDILKEKKVCKILIEIVEKFVEQEPLIDKKKIDKIIVHSDFQFKDVKTCKCYYKYEGDVVSLFKIVMAESRLSIFENGNSYFASLHALYCLSCSLWRNIVDFKEIYDYYLYQNYCYWYESMKKLFEYSKNIIYFNKEKLAEEKLKINVNKEIKFRCVPLFYEESIEIFLVPLEKYEHLKEESFEKLFELDTKVLMDKPLLCQNAMQNKETFFRPFFNKLMKFLEPITDLFLNDIYENRHELFNRKKNPNITNLPYPQNLYLYNMAKEYNSCRNQNKKTLIYTYRTVSKCFFEFNYDSDEKNDATELFKIALASREFPAVIKTSDDYCSCFEHWHYFFGHFLISLLEEYEYLTRIKPEKYKSLKDYSSLKKEIDAETNLEENIKKYFYDNKNIKKI